MRKRLRMQDDERRDAIFSYRGYRTVVKLDAESKTFYGKIENTEDFVNFEAETMAVDDYIEFCQEIEKQ